MTKKTETVIRKYKALSEKEKYDFLKALDEMGGIETFTVGMQIDEFIKFMEEEDWLKCVNEKLNRCENLNRFSKQMATVKSGVTVVILFIVTEIIRLQ